MRAPLPDDGPLTAHGGNLTAAERLFGRPDAGWLDLSTGINPWAYPITCPPPECFARLPDDGVMAALASAAARRYGVRGGAMVVAASGTQALIQCLPALRPPSKVAVVGPTYAEHARAWEKGGHQVETVADVNDAATADVVVVVNPNNPDGRGVAPGRLLALTDRLAARRGLIIVDGAFADVAPGLDLSAEAGRPGLLVLRSPGKFYGLAGLRVGFALAAPTLGAALKDALGPWPVAGPSAVLATGALLDDDWAAATRIRLAERAAALDRTLTAAGLRVAGGTDLFRLIEDARARDLYRFLGGRGILTRPFAERGDWLRLGLPGGDEAFERLAEAVADFAASA